MVQLDGKLTVPGGVATSAHERRRATPPARTRLYEREAFLDEIAAMFSGDWARPNGPVIVEGASWTGRTALLGAARQLAVGSGMTVLRARGNDLERATAWGVVRQLFAPQLEPSGAEAAGGSDAASRAPFDGAAAAGSSRPGQIDAELRHFEESLWRLSSLRPVLVAVDDADLADPESCQWLFYVARRLGNRRAHLVITSGLPKRGVLSAIDRIRAEPTTRVMALQPLGKSSVAEMTASALKFSEAGSEATVDSIYAASGGFPLLVVAILRELSASQGASAAPVLDAVASRVPVRVGKALLARVAALPGDGAHLLAFLQAAAVLGDEADFRSCANLAGLDLNSAATSMDLLVDDGLLSAGMTPRCPQSAVQAALLQEMSSAGRARLHLGAARLLEQRERPAEVVAGHLLLAEHCPDPWAPRRLEEAGRKALVRGDRRTALDLLEKAASEYPRTANASLHLDIARATATTDITAADRHLARAVALGADMREVAHAALALANNAPEGEAVAALIMTLKKTCARLPHVERDLRAQLDLAASELAGPSARAAEGRLPVSTCAARASSMAGSAR